MAMAATTLSTEIQGMRLRLRHIHVPDLPPLYAPRFLPPKIRDFLEGQIVRMRNAGDSGDALQNQTAGAASMSPASEPDINPLSRPPSSMSSWLQRASPPPTVLSFTRPPTYVLPKHEVDKQESWQVDFLTSALKSRMQVKFPEPPQWSSLPWRPSWEQNIPASQFRFDPLCHEWDPAVSVMPCAEAMFFGPGQISIWPIMDLRDDLQRGSVKFRTKYEYERLLEDTTIEVLKREYGIEGFAIPGSPGVWVQSKIPPGEQGFERSDAEGYQQTPRRQNVRRIATIHSDIVNDITRFGVSIHVGQPDPIVDAWSSFTNPWTPIRQHKLTTSVAAELAYIGKSPRHEGLTRATDLYSKRKSQYLITFFNRDAGMPGYLYDAMPYSFINMVGGRREAAPMGMDNRDLSAAWTFEFARQLGMVDGFVDHYSMVDFGTDASSNLPFKSREAGFKSRALMDEHKLTRPYEQVDVQSISPGDNAEVEDEIMESTVQLESNDGKVVSRKQGGQIISWPLYYKVLTKRLDESIKGGPWDTRLKTYHWEREQAARRQRRKAAIETALTPKPQWAGELRTLARRPMTDAIVQKLTGTTDNLEMVELLEAVRAGMPSEQLLNSDIYIRRFLDSLSPRPTHTVDATSRGNPPTSGDVHKDSNMQQEVQSKGPATGEDEPSGVVLRGPVSEASAHPDTASVRTHATRGEPSAEAGTDVEQPQVRSAREPRAQRARAPSHSPAESIEKERTQRPPRSRPTPLAPRRLLEQGVRHEPPDPEKQRIRDQMARERREQRRREKLAAAGVPTMRPPQANETGPAVRNLRIQTFRSAPVGSREHGGLPSELARLLPATTQVQAGSTATEGQASHNLTPVSRLDQVETPGITELTRLLPTTTQVPASSTATEELAGLLALPTTTQVQAGSTATEGQTSHNSSA